MPTVYEDLIEMRDMLKQMIATAKNDTLRGAYTSELAVLENKLSAYEVAA